MKKYRTLKSFYYDCSKDNDFSTYDQIVEKRRNSELVYTSKLAMSPFRHEFRMKEEFNIFFLPSHQLLMLQEKILKLSNYINELMNQLPDVAKDQIFLNTLIDELQSTNDIEGVRSSREEISQTLDKVINGKTSRFSGLVKLYGNFQNDQYNSIKKIEDFRIIWDELVRDEIEDDSEIPDGDLFRTAGEVIKDGEKTVHRGDASEKEIKEHLLLLVEEMNNSDLPFLSKCFVAHYYYEYIHPFYDGNGRTGRFIACSYLSRKLDKMSAINFSSAILKNKTSYYKAFVEMSNPYNKGEATGFIISMMKILIKGQQEIIEHLHDGINQLRLANKITEEKKLPQLEENILFVMCQKVIFGKYVGPITDAALADMLHVTRYKLNKALSVLEKQNLVFTSFSRPKIHGLSKQLIAQLFEVNESYM